VAVAGPIDGERRTSFHGLVFEDLERRPDLAIARQAKVDAAQARTTKAGSCVERRAGVIALGRHRRAAEHILVETRQCAPIRRDQVRVGIASGVGHRDSPSKAL